jgi:hypothetical protein
MINSPVTYVTVEDIHIHMHFTVYRAGLITISSP